MHIRYRNPGWPSVAERFMWQTAASIATASRCVRITPDRTLNANGGIAAARRAITSLTAQCYSAYRGWVRTWRMSGSVHFLSMKVRRQPHRLVRMQRSLLQLRLLPLPQEPRPYLRRRPRQRQRLQAPHPLRLRFPRKNYWLTMAAHSPTRLPGTIAIFTTRAALRPIRTCLRFVSSMRSEE